MKRRIVRRGLSTVAVLAALFAVASWIVGGRLVAPALHVVGPPPDDLPVESVTIDSQSGSSLAGWYVPAEGATATVVLLHPIRADRRAMLSRARLLHEAGYSTLLVDLQAHGESPGEHITIGHLERHDARAAVEYVRRRTPEHKIGIVGRSLGGAAALLGSPLEVDAVVLESVYPTIDEAVHDRMEMRFGPLHHVLAPALLVQLEPRLGISTSDLRPIDHIATVGCPVLVAAGDQDRHTTLAETERLHAEASAPKQLVIFGGAGHNDLLKHDAAQYKDEIVGFLDEHLLGGR
ncbi:alpha/beta hydrolase [Aeoliella sp.]|uniref:alpha/beta hydrolase n=1 Tax=Aeoliella sp. TaxID=2795800 RepID=UPI003CCBE65B